MLSLQEMTHNMLDILAKINNFVHVVWLVY